MVFTVFVRQRGQRFECFGFTPMIRIVKLKIFVIDKFHVVLENFGNVCARHTILFITRAIAVVIFQTKPLNIIS